MKKVTIFTALIAIILIGIYYLIGSLIPKQRPAGEKPPPVEVIVSEVKVRPIRVIRHLPARIKSSKISQVRPQVSGIILEKLFEEGSVVKKGQPLYQIDPKPLFVELEKIKAQLKAAEVNLESKTDNFNRYVKLFAIKAVSENQMDEARVAMQNAKAQYAIINSNLQQTEIKINYTRVPAPISGKISRSYVTEGQLVKDMQPEPLATITAMEKFFADIKESSNAIKSFQEALDDKNEIIIKISLPDDKSKHIASGFLKFSEYIIDESTDTVILRAELKNKDNNLMPGMFVRATIDLGTIDSLVVDQSSVIIQPDGQMMVYIVGENNKAMQKPIQVSGQDNGDWIISSGIEAGDLVIKEGIQKIRSGSDIIPTLSSEDLINTTKKKKQQTDPHKTIAKDADQTQKNPKITNNQNQEVDIAVESPSLPALSMEDDIDRSLRSTKNTKNKEIINNNQKNKVAIKDYQAIEKFVKDNLITDKSEDAIEDQKVHKIEDFNNKISEEDFDKKIREYIEKQLQEAKKQEEEIDNNTNSAENKVVISNEKISLLSPVKNINNTKGLPINEDTVKPTLLQEG